MFRFIRFSRLGALCTLSAILITTITAKGVGFQPNDVVALRGNTTTGAVELDEYNSSGFQTSPLNTVSIQGSFGGGALKLSADGNYLTFASSNLVRVNVVNGTVATSLAPTSIFSVVSSNGTDLWSTGSFQIYYATFGKSTFTQICQSFEPRVGIGIFGGQLYTTTNNTDGRSPPYPITAVGSGLPKVASPETPLPGLPTDGHHGTVDFWFRDSNTLYFTELYPKYSHPGIQKWTFDGTEWQYQYNVFTSPIDYLSGWVDPDGNTVLFATYSIPGTTGNNLLRVVDGGSEALSSSSVLATAPSGSSFGGVAFISAPEPASVVLMAIGALAVFFVVRRRRIAAASIAVGVLCALSATFITAITAQGAGFQPGDVVAVRALSTSSGAAVELDEYNSSDYQTSPLNVLSIPTSNNAGLTISGSDPFEGALKLSGDGNYLTLAGAGDASTSVVGRVNVSDGTVDLSTKIKTSFTLVGAVTSNGTDIWTTDGGWVDYTTLGSSKSTHVIQTSNFEVGTVGIFGGQLYVSFADSTSYRIASVGNGLPKAPSPVNQLPGTVITYGVQTKDFWFRDANTLYLAGATFSPRLRLGVEKCSTGPPGSISTMFLLRR